MRAFHDRPGFHLHQILRLDGRGDEFADAVEMRRVHADVEVRAQRLGEFLAQERAQRPARDPPHDLADEVALSDGVVATGCTRLPPGRLGGEEFRHPIPVVPDVSGVDLVETRQAGAVAHQMAHFDAFLAVGGELRPVLGDRRVEVEFATVGEQERA